jgi:hypothetical protein
MSLEKKEEMNEVERVNDASFAKEKSSGPTNGVAADTLLPDPDAGLSDEERALIVSRTL